MKTVKFTSRNPDGPCASGGFSFMEVLVVIAGLALVVAVGLICSQRE